MNRIPRRSAAEEADALLEAGRTQPVLNYDVELGLARHHHWLRSEAPVPDWASASAGTAAKSFMPVLAKTLVSTVLIGAVGVAAWQLGGRSQPSAASVQPASPSAAVTPPVAPSVREVPASDAWMAHTPIPVPDHGVASEANEPPVRRTARADAAEKRSARVQRDRARKEWTTARAARAALARGRTASRADTTPARAEPAEPTTAQPSEAVSAGRATRSEVAAVPERKPSTAANRARPEPAPQAQRPDDLIEMQQVAAAEQLLERSPERALALVRQGDQRFASGYFQQERAYIAIMALIRLGRVEEARTRAASFAQNFPALPYGARIRSALEARDAAAAKAASRDADP
jgi:hypothetical protein